MLILIVPVFRAAEVKAEPVYQRAIQINPARRELDREIEVHHAIILQREAAAVEIEAEAVREIVKENHRPVVRVLQKNVKPRHIIRRPLLHHRLTVRLQVQALIAVQDLREVLHVRLAALPDLRVIREEEDNS